MPVAPPIGSKCDEAVFTLDCPRGPGRGGASDTKSPSAAEKVSVRNCIVACREINSGSTLARFFRRLYIMTASEMQIRAITAMIIPIISPEEEAEEAVIDYLIVS